MDGSDLVYLRESILRRVDNRKEEKIRILGATILEIDQNIGFSNQFIMLSTNFIKNNKHFLNRYRVNCLEKMLELNIENKEISNVAMKIWNTLVIQNKHLDEIGLAVGTIDEKKKSKQRFTESTKEHLLVLQLFRGAVLSYIESLR